MTKSLTSRILFSLRPSTLDAMLADIDINAGTDDDIVAAVALIQEERDAHGVAEEPTGSGPFAYLQSDGMQWLVLGFVPGPMEFLAGFETRALAVDFLRNEYRGQTFEFFAIVKARDLFMAP